MELSVEALAFTAIEDAYLKNFSICELVSLNRRLLTGKEVKKILYEKQLQFWGVKTRSRRDTHALKLQRLLEI